MLILADVWVPNVKCNRGKKVLFIIPKSFLMKRSPLVLLSTWISWESFFVEEWGKAQLLSLTKEKDFGTPRSNQEEGMRAEIEREEDRHASQMAEAQAFRWHRPHLL